MKNRFHFTNIYNDEKENKLKDVKLKNMNIYIYNKYNYINNANI